jgi:predicted small integral membrane protein
MALRLSKVALVATIALWLGGLMAIGGEWFGMWMSTQWNGLASAFRFVVVLLAALLFLGQRDGECDD